MDNDIYIETLICNYINGSISEDEKKQVTDLLQQNEIWRKKYDELLQLHQSIQNSLALESPSLRFTKNIMEEIALAEIAPSAKTYINQKIINKLALFFITCIAGLLVYILFKVDWSKNELEHPFVNIDLSSKSYLKPQHLSIFLAANTVLFLIFIDKLLFRANKKSKGSNTDLA